jgi:mannosyltransferase OCH1-like enzyme
MKYKITFILFLLLLLAYNFDNPIKRLVFGNEDGRICYNRSLKNAAFGENISFEKILKQRRDLLSTASARTTERPIPKISHHTWITKADSPKEINPKDLEYIKRTLRFASKDDGWTNIFWTNNQKLIPNTIKELSEFGVIVKELNHSNIKNFSKIEQIYTKAFDYNLSMPNDIVSYSILEEYGGVYFDVDYELKKSINDLLNKYSFLVFEDSKKNLYIAHGIIAAIPKHPVVNEAIELMIRNFSNVRPDYVAFACHDRAFTVSATGPAMLSIAFFNKANKGHGLNDTFMTNNINLYSNIPHILHNSIGRDHGSNNWKKKGESTLYPHCRKCIKLK